MSKDYVDPSGNTEQFRAFVASPEPAPEKKSALPIVIAVIVAVIVIGGIIGFIAAR